jgi:hypothetical protein
MRTVAYTPKAVSMRYQGRSAYQPGYSRAMHRPGAAPAVLRQRPWVAALLAAAGVAAAAVVLTAVLSRPPPPPVRVRSRAADIAYLAREPPRHIGRPDWHQPGHWDAIAPIWEGEVPG